MSPRRLSLARRALVVAAAAATLATPVGSQAPAPVKPVVGRSQVATTLGIVATSQPLAARVGVQILERGGNAVDAAIATNAALGLMEPHRQRHRGRPVRDRATRRRPTPCTALNASGWSPAGLSPAFLAARGIDAHAVTRHPLGHGPGRGRGLGRACGRSSGPVPFAELLAPAIYYAEHGFPVSEVIAAWWKRAEPRCTRHIRTRGTPTWSTARAPRGRARCSGIPTSPQRCARSPRSGRDGFYTGRDRRGHRRDLARAGRHHDARRPARVRSPSG